VCPVLLVMLLFVTRDAVMYNWRASNDTVKQRQRLKNGAAQP
jgi:hypothetical protein